jgi:hypothetical protein
MIAWAIIAGISDRVHANSASPTWNPTLWCGPTALVNGVLILALAAYGLRTALAGRPMFGAGTLEGGR